MCGCLGVLLFVGSLFYLWDGLLHGFGSATQLALLLALVGVISVIGYVGSRKR